MQLKFYHVQRIHPAVSVWGKGQIVRTENGLQHNPYFEGILNSLRRVSKKRKEGEDLMEDGYLFFNRNDCDDKKKIQKFGLIGYQLSMQYQKWIREEIFEKVRSKDFPLLPSRKQCIWITQKELVPYWNQEILKSGKVNATTILEISRNEESKIHIADQYFLEIGAYSIEDLENRAIDYWSGNLSKNPRMEILLEGSLTVTNTYDNINEWLLKDK